MDESAMAAIGKWLRCNDPLTILQLLGLTGMGVTRVNNAIDHLVDQGKVVSITEDHQPVRFMWDPN